MPQLSLYIDKETLKKLKIAARIEHLSISKYAVKKLNEFLKELGDIGRQDEYVTIRGIIRPDSAVGD